MKEVIELVIRKDRVFGLWKGLQPSIMRCVPGVGIYFSTLHLIQSKTLGEGKPAAYQSLILGASARTFTATLLIPFTVVKTRIESGNFKYSGVTGALRSIYSLEGRSGLAAGLSATVVRDAPFSAVYLMCYNEAKAFMSSVAYNPIGGAVNFVCGVGAGICASIFTQPADVIKTKMQLNQDRKSFRQVTMEIYMADGFAGYFRGLVPRVIRRTLIAAMAWTVYEEIMKRLGLST